MEKKVPILFVFLIFLGFQSLAQDHLNVQFENAAAVPDFINVCGLADTATVLIGLEGGDPNSRQNIQAGVQLFRGMYFEGLDLSNSTPGVSVDATDPTRPVFTIPDLSPSGLTSARITYRVYADCAYLDTIDMNNLAQVRDEWVFDYDINGSSEQESDINAEYRDAMAVPIFTAMVSNAYGPAREGDCFSRDIIFDNSGADGFVDTLLYQNRQGAGVFVQSIEVNGVPVSFTKDTIAGGDTLIQIVLDSMMFVNNSGGDTDGLFEPGERVVITENICVQSCTGDRSSLHIGSWGCYGTYCTDIPTVDFVEIGNGAANLDFQTFGATPTVDVGYCQTGTAVLTLTNDGTESDPGFAAMIDIAVGVGVGVITNPMNCEVSVLPMSDSSLTITSISIAGINMPTLSFLDSLDGNALFAVDPDGPAGLADMDGDGFFDDLPLNESIEVVVEYEYDCSSVGGPGDDGTCRNPLNSRLSARLDYTNSCRQRIFNCENSFLAVNNLLSLFSGDAPTDVFMDEDTIQLSWGMNRFVRNFDRDCSGNEVFEIKVVLPAGINLISSLLNFTISGSPIPLLGTVAIGDTLFLTYDASLLPTFNGFYEMNIRLDPTCTATVGPSSFDIEMAVLCPDCSCRHNWFCETIQGPQIHANVPPCPPTVFSCPEGLRTFDVSVERTTFGFTDASYTTQIDPAVANRKVALSCDSVRMTVNSVVGDAVVNDSIGVVISYGNADGSNNLVETFLFDSAEVRFTNAGSEYFCTIDNSVLTTLQVDSIKVMRFDLHDCLTGLGINLAPSDTITFTGFFSINPNGPYPVMFTEIPNLRGYAYATVDNVDEACDNFGETFTVGRNTTAFSFPSSLSFPRGCEETYINYNLISVVDAYNAQFGAEFRQLVLVDSITFTFDTSLINGFTVFEPEVKFSDHPIHGNNYFPAPSFAQFPDGRYVARFDTLTSVPAFNDGTSTPFTFRIRAIPNCGSSFRSENGNATYNLDPTIYYVNRHYANFIGDGSCAEKVVDYRDNDLVYTNPPDFSLDPSSSPVVILDADTAVWLIQHCNVTNNAAANVSWFAIEDSTAAIQVVSIENISDPGNIQSLTLNNYGSNNSNYFGFSTSIEPDDGINGLEEYCNTYRVKALVNRCGTTNFRARAGWECAALPLTWNPDDNPPCDEESLALTVVTQSPVIEANVAEQPSGAVGLCDTVTIAIEVRNSGLGTAFDMRNDLILPLSGATLVAGSVEIAYPADSAYVSVATDPVYAGTNHWGQIYRYDDFSNLHSYLNGNGLKGFDPGVDSNEYRIRFRFETDCDFRSGSIVYYELQGQQGCSDPTNIEVGETTPILISGASGGLAKLYDIYFEENSTLATNAVTEVGITVRNLTPIASDANKDKISLRLPLDINYQTGTSIAIEPSGWNLTEPDIDTIDGFQFLNWCLPDGLLQNDSAVMRLKLSSPFYTCDSSSILTQLYTYSVNQVSCSSGGNCDIGDINSTNNGQLINLPIDPNPVRLDNVTITSSCLNATSEEITVSGQIINNGPDINARPVTIRFYHDVNDDGGWDVGDVVVSTHTNILSLPMGAFFNFSHSFSASPTELCSLLWLIDTTGLNLCSWNANQLSTPQLQNAGQDKTICATSNTQFVLSLGDTVCQNMSGYTYNWTAIAPASTGDLNIVNIAAPTLTVDHSGMNADTLYYILETTRSGCAQQNFDTVRIIRGIPPSLLNTINDTSNCNGDDVDVSLTLNENISSFLITPDSAQQNAQIVGGNILTFTASYMNAPTAFQVTLWGASGCEVIETFSIQTCGGGIIPCSMAPVIRAISSTAASCGNTNGTASISVNDVLANYEFRWTPSLGAANTEGNARVDLPVGGYRVEVINRADTTCRVSTTVVVPNVDGPQATWSAVPASCQLSNGTAQLNPVSYDYRWADGSTSDNRNDLSEGLYPVTVTDPAQPGCTNVILVEIESTNDLAASANMNTLPDCGLANGEVTIQPSGGSGNYAYTWSSGNTTATESNLNAGVHSVTIIDQTSGCELTYVFSLDDNIPSATISVNSFTNLTCSGQNNGFLDYNINYPPGFVDPPTTFITNGVDTFVNGNLPAGDFCLMVLDANGCQAASNCFSISTPDPFRIYIMTEEDCDVDTARIDLTVEGGDGNYAYDWSDLSGFFDPEDRSGLSSGVYTVTIVDGNNCQHVETVNLGNCGCQPPDLTSTVIQEANCGGSDGMALIGLSQDEAQYTYEWTPDAGISNLIGNGRSQLPVGGYRVRIVSLVDTTCTLIVPLVISADGGPQPSVVTTPASCAAADGTATFSSNTFNYEWEDSSTASSRNDLSAGIYFVTVTDPGDATCPNVIKVEIEEGNNLTINHLVSQLPTCGLTDGEVSLSVTGGSGSYRFQWSDGLDTLSNMRADLAAGTYRVTVIDNNPGTACESVYVFALQNSVPGAVINIDSISDANCVSSTTGQVYFSTLFSPSLVQPADTIITDGINTFNNGQLPAGDYCLEIRDGNNCIAGVNCFTISEPEAMSIEAVVTPSCNLDGTMDITVFGGSSPYTFDWSDLSDPVEPEDRNGLGFGLYQVQVTDANGCTLIEDGLLIPACPRPDTCNFFASLSDSVFIQASDCNGTVDLCLDLPDTTMAGYTVTVNGVPYLGGIVGCTYDSIPFYPMSDLIGDGDLGPYEMLSWQVGDTVYAGIFQDLLALTDSMNRWDPAGLWTLDTLTKNITSGQAGTDYGDMLIQALQFAIDPERITTDYALAPIGFAVNLPVGNMEVVLARVADGCSDTLYAQVVCTEPDTIRITIPVRESDTLCLNTSDFEIYSSINSISNNCPENPYFRTRFLADTNCVVFEGVVPGVETACLVVCDSLGVCDELFVIVTVTNNNELVIDTVSVGEQKRYCLDVDSLDLSGPVSSVVLGCFDQSDGNISWDFDADSLCLTYTGLKPGVDTSCVVVCDTSNFCDTVTFIVFVRDSSVINSGIFCDSVYINQSKLYCLDTTQLPGVIINVEDICADQTTGLVDFFIDPVNFCIEYRGLELGQDTACIVLEDNFGLMDTTNLCLFITENLDPPIANDDLDTTTIGNPVVIDIKSNDILFGGVDTAYILEPPSYGTIGIPSRPNELNLDCSATYTASEEFCERFDQFTYVVCTPNGCDTASVFVWIECVDIFIFTAVSPNGDGVNDVFFISGIEDFPNNELTVFNRWGNIVFQTIGYQNDWAGKWKGTKDLPDGTYFYELELNDDEDRVFTGYLEIFR